MSEATKRRPRFSLSTWILIGILLGVGVGLFFGEPAAALQPLGDAFIRLLQMTILPYMVVALIAGLGKLTMADARLLALRGGAVMVLFWVVGFAIAAGRAGRSCATCWAGERPPNPRRTSAGCPPRTKRT